MRRFSSLAIVALLLALAAPLHAQQGGAFAVSAGPTAPVGDLAEGTGFGYHVQLSVQGRPPVFGGPTLRLDGMWANVGGKDGGVDVATWTVNLNLVIAGALDRASGGVRPYGLGGVGYYHVTPDFDGAEGKGVLGFNVGAGLEFELGQDLGAFFEFRYHHAIGAFEEAGLVSLEKTPAQFIPITFGVRF
jgi:opacity protein-like surface antigen